MKHALHWFEATFGMSPPFQGKLLTSILLIVAIIVIRRIFLRIALKKTEKVRTRYQWHKFSRYAAWGVGIILVGREWLEGFHSLSTFLGLFTAGLAIALKDPIMNVVGWAYIMISRPYSVGDRIQLGTHCGDVIDQQIFQVSLLEIGNWVNGEQSTGRILHIPNGKIFTDALANYNQGLPYIWDELPLTVSFDSDWKKAKELVSSIITKHGKQASDNAAKELQDVAKQYMIYYKKLEPIVYTSPSDVGVALTIRYLCEPRKRRDKRQAIWEEVLDAFAKAGDIHLVSKPGK